MARCIHCLDHLSPDLVAIGVRTCGRCAVLLQELGDAVVEPPPPQPAREPGCDDRPAFTTVIACERGGAPKPRHDARWLYAAVRKRGKVREALAIGRRLRLHSNMLCWSVDQVDQVVAALVAAKTPR
jgi:hypothetical protein